MIPSKSNRKVQREIDSYCYRRRNRVERFFNRIEQFRRIATRYHKLAARYAAHLLTAAIFCWTR